MDKARVLDVINKTKNNKGDDSNNRHSNHHHNNNYNNNHHNNTVHANATKVTFMSSMTEKFDNKGSGSGCEDEKAMDEEQGLVDHSRQRGGRYDVGMIHDIGDNSYH